MNAADHGTRSSDLVREVMRHGRLELPRPGAGRTAERHRRLAALARADLSVARLAEAHTDAVAILAERDRHPRSEGLHGVWASDRPGTRLLLRATSGGLVLDGTKEFCSGVGLCDAALVTAELEGTDRPVLVEVDLLAARAAGRVQESAEGWATPAFADTATGTLCVDGLAVDDDDLVGPPGWYLDRPGFWHGAIGPAAVWAGGAQGLIDTALDQSSSDPHVHAHLGALRALDWSLSALLDVAGAEIDRDPFDLDGRAAVRALSVRHLVERQATEVLDRFGRALGPALLAFDPATVRRHAELTLSLRQCHAERDLAALHAHDRERTRPHRRDHPVG